MIPGVRDASAPRTARWAGIRLWLAAAGVCIPASAAVGAVALASILRETGGSLVPPLDDPYIYLQYARNLAEGRLYRYGPGEPYTTGATSLLYPWLLAPAFHLGLDGPRAVYWAWGLNQALHAACAFLLFALAARWLGRGAALLAAALFLLSGWMLWAVFNLLESGLYVALLLGTLLAWDHGRQRGSFAAFGAVGALLVLARPEGAAVAAALAGLALVDRAAVGGVRGLRDARLLPLLLPVVLAVSVVAVNRAITGSPTNGLVAKSVLYDFTKSRWEMVSYTAGTFVRQLWVPFAARQYVPLLMPVPALGGAAAVLWSEARARRPGLGWAITASFLVGVASASINMTPWAHWYRYEAPYYPLYVLLAVAGLVRLGRSLRAGGFLVLPVGGAALAVLSLPVFLNFAGSIGDASGDIHRQHVPAAAWLRDHVPPGERVAVNDAGALAYLSGRPIYDLVGLTTNGAALPMWHGPGSVMERLERLPPEERPGYFAVYDTWFWDEFRPLPMMRELQRFTLDRAVVAGDREKAVYAADRAAYGSGERLVEDHGQDAGWRAVDAVDVADLEDEAAHDYRLLERVRPGLPATVVHQWTYASGAAGPVLDGGREAAVGEAFTLWVTPGRPLRLVLRTDAPEAGVREVYVDGRFAGLLAYEKSPGGWVEPELTVPAELVRRDRVRVEVRLRRPLGTERFTSFHYWALQPVAQYP